MVSSEKLLQILREHFAYSNFRPGQEAAVRSILSGQDTFVLLPTGGGKSLIYQLPAVYFSSGVILVISPLISLMKDQAESLEHLGIPAAVYNSSIDELEQLKALSNAVTGKIRVLFLSPERAVSSYFLNQAKQMQVKMLVIDEAHCISRWGHDFRPEYTKLMLLQEALDNKAPVLALTATATANVQKEIYKYLGLKDANFVQESFLRENLSLAVKFCSSDEEKRQHILQELEALGSHDKAIIYCATRKATEDLAKFLKPLGSRVGYYHGGKPEGFRERAQNQFLSGKKNILLATNAFGLGIDIPTIRLVMHYQIPGSVEAYYQEAGRAGRDRRPARCVLLYQEKDLAIQKRLSFSKTQSNLWEKVKEYAYSQECRQRFLCNYFAEEVEDCQKCDVCRGDNASGEEWQKTWQKKEAQKKQDLSYNFQEGEEEAILNFVGNFSGKFGKTIVCNVLRGSEAKDVLKFRLENHPLHGKLAHIPVLALKDKIDVLVKKGSLRIKGKKYPKLATPYRSMAIAKSPSLPKQIQKNTSRNQLLRELRNFRDREARRKNQKKYMILANQVLTDIAAQKPQTAEDLLAIKGMGQVKTQLYAQEILHIIHSFSSE
ncbi:MAG: RecQ family ATP-dependent DNA helicase [Spirochaetota bacterium]